MTHATVLGKGGLEVALLDAERETRNVQVVAAVLLLLGTSRTQKSKEDIDVSGAWYGTVRINMAKEDEPSTSVLAVAAVIATLSVHADGRAGAATSTLAVIAARGGRAVGTGGGVFCRGGEGEGFRRTGKRAEVVVERKDKGSGKRRW